MRIVGFLQVRNELRSGHLERFLAANAPLLDRLYVYDDGSDDGTADFLEERDAVVIRGTRPQFGREQYNRRSLLRRVLEDIDQDDFILWLDADEVLYASRPELEQVCHRLLSEGYDAATLPHINLWRSPDFLRSDDGFDALKPVRIWRNNGQLAFDPSPGLHRPMYPDGLGAILDAHGPAVVHYGFASDAWILAKHGTYYRHWQAGFRLINEVGRILQPLQTRAAVLGSRFEELHPDTAAAEPNVRSAADWFLTAEREIREIKAPDTPVLTIVCLIYASVQWAEFAYAEILRAARELPRGDVEVLFVANDATDEVLDFLASNQIPHVSVSKRAHPDEWFINGVYRAYNAGAEHARGDYVLFVNSDMCYAPGAIGNLMQRADSDLLLASRLVEQGVMQTGTHGLERSFGASPKRLRRRDFYRYAREIADERTEAGGLFMPLLVDRRVFLDLGGYPEGNVTPDSLDAYVESGAEPRIATKGEELIPGDAAFIARAAHHGVHHATAFDSIVYHFQAGEMRTSGRLQSATRSGFAIANDQLIGINGEEVLWGALADRLADAGYCVTRISAEGGLGMLRYWRTVRTALRTARPRVLFANATYVIPQRTDSRYVVLRQDHPSRSWLQFLQNTALRWSDHVVANDADFVASRRTHATWLPVPLSDCWVAAPTREPVAGSDPMGRPTAIFIGAFNETKGWNDVRSLIESRDDIHWVVVSKYANDEHGLPGDVGPNWEVHRQLEQTTLRSLMEKATFLISNAPYETQCLVALEAAACDVPVLMRPTGLIASLAPEDRNRFGVITDDISEGIDQLLDRIQADSTLGPREVLEDLGFVGERAITRWVGFFEEQLRESFIDDTELPPVISFIDRLFNYAGLRVRQTNRNLRRRVLALVRS